MADIVPMLDYLVNNLAHLQQHVNFQKMAKRFFNIKI